jgi:hypothetical protein
MDIVGRGTRLDYCRMVTRNDDLDREIDSFLACDLGSKGGYSYWFRSFTKDEGLPDLEIPYAKQLDKGSFDSYCGVIPPTKNKHASVACLRVSGLGFGGGTLPDPDPPERVRVRLRTYENLKFWLPLVGHTKSSGSFTDRVGKISMRASPLVHANAGMKTSGGAPYLRALSHVNLNTINVFSCMIKPNANSQSGSNEMILFAGDDAHMNEISLQKTITNKITFMIYEGRAEAFKMTSGNVKPGEWNHILLQYKNGYWYMYVNGLGSGKKEGPRHSFMKRNSFLIARTLPQHASNPFVGTIADIRLYSQTLSKTGIQAIQDDFNYSLHETGAGERLRTSYNDHDVHARANDTQELS